MMLMPKLTSHECYHLRLCLKIIAFLSLAISFFYRQPDNFLTQLFYHSSPKSKYPGAEDPETDFTNIVTVHPLTRVNCYSAASIMFCFAKGGRACMFYYAAGAQQQVLRAIAELLLIGSSINLCLYLIDFFFFFLV